MSYCAKCGQKLQSGEKFCGGCGAPVAGPEATPEKVHIGTPIIPKSKKVAGIIGFILSIYTTITTIPAFMSVLSVSVAALWAILLSMDDSWVVALIKLLSGGVAAFAPLTTAIAGAAAILVPAIPAKILCGVAQKGGYKAKICNVGNVLSVLCIVATILMLVIGLVLFVLGLVMMFMARA